MSGKPNELIVLNTIEKEGERLQNAFHKWNFLYKIVHVQIIDTALYILFDTGDIAYINLEIPGDISGISYMDTYSGTPYPVEYESLIEFSQFFLRDGNQRGTQRGRFQIRTLLYSVTDNSSFETWLYNKDLSLLRTDQDFGPYWTDTDNWDDTLQWTDVDPLYYRIYRNDKKITALANAQKTIIVFKNNTINTDKGFELATVNVEALYYQRSRRT